MKRDTAVEKWLDGVLQAAGAIAGTLHRHQEGGLRLVAAVHIPEPVQQAVAWVPPGKGMAGMALQLGQPIQTCNLQDDRSGAVRPGAKAVDARAAVALPLRDPSGAIIAVLGIAFADERELDLGEIERLEALGAGMPEAAGGEGT